ncbi:MAG: ABC transporter substrate-binding protein [Proteobacteria bacterium]|nr:ABC transporter substrate-binding protein [Pseudomonadota bacterium]
MAQPAGELTVVVPTFGKEQLDVGLTSTQELQFNSHPYDALIGATAAGELAPERGLAESWQMNAAATELTVKLRRNVRWHDGKPFTAADVVFNFGERFRAKDATCTFCGSLKTDVKEVKALDDYTVRFTLSGTNPTFPATLSGRDTNFRLMAPQSFKKTDEGYQLAGNPIGTGPWKFVSFQRGVEARFAANTDYWDKARIPEFATMRLVPRTQPATRLAMVRAGEADFAFIDLRQAPEARSLGLKLFASKGATITILSFLGCWQENIWCHNTLFRKAMVHAIDMEAIFGRAFPEGTGHRVANSVWIPVAYGYDPKLPFYDFDPEAARQLLKEIGYDGTPVKIWVAPTNSSPETPEIMQLVDGYLRAAGFKTEVTPLEFGAFRPRYAQPPQNFPANYAAHLHVNAAGARPDVIHNLTISWISQKQGGLIQGYWDLAKIDAEYRRLHQIASLETLRRELLKLNQETWGEYPFFTIAARNVVAVAGKRVAGWTPTDYGFAWHFETIRQAK